MKSIILLLAVIVGFAQAQDRGAIRLKKPYLWELKSSPYVPAGRLFKTQSSSWVAFGPAPSQSTYYGTVSGRVTSLAVDPTNSSVVYAAAAGGGLWKSIDGGTTWTSLTDNFPRLSSGAIALDPNNPSTVYYGTGELNFNIDGYPGAGIFKSTNGGASWTPMALPLGGAIYYTSKIVVAPSNSSVVYAAGYWDAYKSTNAGQTWTELDLTHGAVDDIVVDPTNANTVYAAYGSSFAYDSTSYGIHTSTDGGATWSYLQNGLPPSTQISRVSLAISPSNPQVLYAAINGSNPNNSSSDTNRVYTTTDGGAHWTVLPSVSSKKDFGGGQGWYNNVIAVDPTNSNTVYVGGIDFWKSTNGGQTWTNLTNGYTGGTVHVDQHAIAFANGSSSTFYIGNDGGVWKTGNSGSSFTDCNTNLQTIQFYSIDVDQNNPVISVGGTQDNGTQKNTQPSLVWNEIYGGDGGYVLIDPKNPNIIYTEYVNGSLQKSTNGGATFTQITTGITEDGYWLTPYVMDPQNDNILYTGTNRIYKSTDAGSNWTPVSQVLESSTRLVTTMSISPVQDSVIYAGLSGYRGASTAFLFISTDSGGTWNDISGNLPAGANFARITADPTQKGVAYAAILSGLPSHSHVLRTTNYGNTWTPLDSTGNGFADVPTKIICIDSLNANIYAGTYAGVYASTDNGATWSQFGSGLPNSVVDDIAIQYSSHTLRVGTHGRGAWQIDLTTGIASPANNTPTTFAVNQNYPNPFNPSTAISYQLSANSYVTLKVYDVLGREMATLVNGQQNAGYHSVAFNAGSLPSGVYFYRITAGNYSSVKKMVLMK